MTDQTPGNYPPPPPGGYPPPPTGGYPPPAQPYRVGDAFSWAWNKFSKNAGALIIATLVYGLVVFAAWVLVNLIAMAVSTETTSSVSEDGGFTLSYDMTGPAAVIVMLIGWLITLVMVAAIQSAYLSGMLDIVDGREVTVGAFLRPRNVANVVIAGLIVGMVTTGPLLLCAWLGALVGGAGAGVLYVVGVILFAIASVMLMFTVVALLDRNLTPTAAIKTSFDISRNNLGNVLLAWLVMTLALFVGGLLCFVGLLVTAPVAVLLLVYTYRRLGGGQVAPRTL